ncbi:MAG: ribose 5-phosphate isomerase B, partial [Chloroflexota bacterium]
AVLSMPVGSTQVVAAGTLVTPLARQVALERRIRLVEGEGRGEATGREGVLPLKPSYPVASPLQREVALGADHGGYNLKEQLKEVVKAAGYGVVDCGTHNTEPVDYPDYAYAVARLVADGRAWRGILVDGAGIGSCMAANKVPGVRAAMCYDQATAVNSREHNDANVLTLGAGLIGPHLAQQIVRTWLATEFAGGRHARRVEKIEAIGRRYGK